MRVVSIVGFVLVCVSAAMAGVPDDGCVVVTDIAYYGDRAPDDYARDRCRLDVWHPPSASGCPTLVWFHGGGLTTGDRQSGAGVARRLTAAGMAVVLVDYRLSPQATCPAYIDDAAAAVAWTMRRIGQYGGDPRRLFVAGHSAGAYLTAMVGFDRQYLARHAAEPSELAGLIPISGQMFTHFTVRAERGIGATTPLIDALAPAHHAAEHTPPCLGIVGDQDLPTRLEENLYCAAAFRAAGNEQVTCQVFAGRDHSTLISRFEEPDDAVADAVIRFIQTVPPARLTWPPADRRADVDEQGVLRWEGTGEEVALFGVNYYTPFWHNYPDLRQVGASHKEVIDQDVLHFARLGLDALRLHVFDREVSDQEGNLLENEQLDLLDYLIAQAKQRGIYTVLTPIAWWPVPGASLGFSNRFTMQQMTTDLEARRLQICYLQQFLSHVNPYTGLAYRDDPAIVCLELINEPLYPADTTDQQVVDYINALAAAIHETGCHKPIFYNGWCDRLDAVGQADVEGVSFGWYPSGLVAGRSLHRNFLPLVNEYGGSHTWNPSMRSPAISHRAKIIYEFDAADVPGSYMYPAMARSFRAGGAQIATQFQYDPLPLARFNQGWQTHYLNLVCTPQKAISFLIAGEAFRRLPRLQDYGPYPESSRFDGFRVSYEDDLSELVSSQEFFHSNTTSTVPPSSATIERVIGCGSSPVVEYDGTGAYFLERLRPGIWRLEVYPDVVWINDPYGASSLNREVARVLWRTRSMQIRLDDLGDEFQIAALDAGNTFTSGVEAGRFAIRPGVYLVSHGRLPADNGLVERLTAGVKLREYIALPELHPSWAVRHEPPARWMTGSDLPVRFVVAGPVDPDRVILVAEGSDHEAPRRIELAGEDPYHYAGVIPGSWLTSGTWRYRVEVDVAGAVLPVPDVAEPSSPLTEWHIDVVAASAPTILFEAGLDAVKPWGSVPFSQRIVPGEGGEQAIQIAVERFDPPPSAVAFRHEVDERWDPWRKILAQRSTLILRARVHADQTSVVEVVLLERDGAAWGVNVPVSTAWQDIRVPLDTFRYFPHWAGTPTDRGQPDDHVRVDALAAVSVCFGAWLFPEHAAQPHTVEVARIAVE
ncbi:MAG: alpha/beta hydrolase fold domain-containing protein [Pirellulaceae bacterium]